MSPVRPLRRDDLPQVAALYETRLSGGRRARPGMVQHFAHQFLEAPTVDPEIPSLVATDGGDRHVIGFLGSSVVPMVLDGQPARAVATGPLFTEPKQHLVSVLLLRGLLAGPQELTVSDKHNLAAHRLFARLGARAVHPRCVWWEVTLRPAERGVAASAPVQGEALVAEPLTPALAAAGLPELAGWARLRPAYEASFIGWRFAQLALARRLGALQAVALRDAAGRLVGWFVALIPEAGVATAVQVIAREGWEGSVLRSLIDAVRAGGVIAVRGRLEPELAFALRDLPCALSQRACLLVHANDEAVWQALMGDRAILTLLDGEPWLAEMHEGRRA